MSDACLQICKDCVNWVFFAGDYVHRGIPLHMKFTMCGNKCFGFLKAINVFTMEIDLWNDE